jgi:GT2 family glycosyltransferase
VYGQHEYTHAVVEDLEREAADYMIVDNRGDYPRLGRERVITPGQNLGWAGGSNVGFRIAFSDGYSHAMTLNNDTRISRGFVSAVLDPRLPDDAGLVSPVYDDAIAFKEMVAAYDGPAAEYTPVPRYRALPAIDGTAMVITRDAWRTVGELDTRSFSRYGWGAEIDLNLRVKRAGFGLYATEMAFVNHFGRTTGNAEFGKLQYFWVAKRGARRGMRQIHGKRWSRELTAKPETFDMVDQVSQANRRG